MDELKVLNSFTFYIVDLLETGVYSLTNYIHETGVINGSSLEILKEFTNGKCNILIDLGNFCIKKPNPGYNCSSVTETIDYNAGILFSKPINFINSRKCFKIQDNFCKCRIPCVLRNISNTFLNRDRYFPLKAQEVDIFKFKEPMKTIETKRNTKEMEETVLGMYKRIINKSSTIQASTRKTYENTITSMYNHSLMAFVKVPKLFMMELQKRYSKSSIIKNLCILQVFFENISNNEIKRLFGAQDYTLIKNVGKVYKDIVMELQDNTKMGNKSSRQEDNWATWSEIKDLVDVLYDVYLSNKTECNLQNYMGLKMHVHQNTLRNDYSSLMFRNYNEESDNYVDLNKNVITWNKFKTSKHHGTITYEITDDIREDLEFFINYRKGQDEYNHLFLKNGKPMNNEQFGYMIRGITRKYLNKSIGCQLLRTIKVSEFRKDDVSYEKEQEFAKNMQHTTAVSRKHYRKQ
jgi:hypothetical protein